MAARLYSAGLCYAALKALRPARFYPVLDGPRQLCAVLCGVLLCVHSPSVLRGIPEVLRTPRHAMHMCAPDTTTATPGRRRHCQFIHRMVPLGARRAESRRRCGPRGTAWLGTPCDRHVQWYRALWASEWTGLDRASQCIGGPVPVRVCLSVCRNLAARSLHSPPERSDCTAALAPGR